MFNDLCTPHGSFTFSEVNAQEGHVQGVML
jgi:hypothetical protein